MNLLFKTLMKKQFLEMSAFFYQKGKGKRRSTGFIILYVLLILYAYFAFSALFYLTAKSLCAPLVKAGLSWFYFAFIGTIAAAAGVIGSIFIVHSKMYQAKDNELLLSMPIPPSKILFVRMFGTYIISVVFETIVLVPAYIVYWTIKQPSAVMLFIQIMFIFILPLFSLTLSLILGFVLGIVLSHINNGVKNFLMIIMTLAFIVLYYSVYLKINTYFQMILTNSDKIGSKIKTFFYPVYQMGMAAEGRIKEFIISAALIILLFAAVYFVISKSFIRIATSAPKFSKAHYNEEVFKNGTRKKALFKKEILRFTGSAVYMLNSGIGIVILILGSVFAVINADKLNMYVSQICSITGISKELIICAVVCMMVSTIYISAPSISLEGKNIWIIKSLPIDSWQVIKTKIKFHLVFAIFAVVISTFCIEAVLKADILLGILVMIFNIMYTFLGAVFGITIDLKMPNLEWKNETEVVKQGIGVVIVLFGSFAVVLALGVIYYLLRNVLSAELFMLLCIAAVGMADLFLFKRLKKKGTEIFAEL